MSTELMNVQPMPARAIARPRLLVMTPHLPCADRNSGDRRLVELMRMLNGHGDVFLYLMESSAGCHHGLSPSDASAYLALLRDLGIQVISGSRLKLSRLIVRYWFSTVIFEFYTTARQWHHFIRFWQPRAALIIDSVDLTFLREGSAAVLGLLPGEEASRVRLEEVDAYRLADGVIVITEEEQRFLATQEGLTNLFVIPNIVPFRPRPQQPRQPEVLFVGGFRHGPNVDGITWFVSTIWPLVQAQVADARLAIVGSAMPPAVESLLAAPGVEVLGYVPDTRPFLDRAAVSIAPLRYGAGMKGKVNEAMAAGLPVVSTSFGVQGLAVTSGKHCLVADDATGFAEALVTLLRDPASAEAIGKAGQELTATVCSAERVEHLVLEMMRKLLTRERMPSDRLLKHQTTALVHLVRTFLGHARRHLHSKQRQQKAQSQKTER